MAEKEKYMKMSLSRTVLGGVVACLLAFVALPFTTLSVVAAQQTGTPDIASIDAYISAQMQIHDDLRAVCA